MKNWNQEKFFFILSIFLAFFFISVPSGYAAITFDAWSEGNTGYSGASSLTVPHNVGTAGTNRILMVGVNIFQNPVSAPVVSSMTYAGQTMTSLGGVNDSASDARIRSEMWYIIAPATGTNDIVITFNATVKAVAGGMSYTGVDQTTPLGTAATAGAASGTTASVAVSSTTGELVVDTAGARQNTSGTQTLTVGANQTERYNDVAGTSGNSTVVGAGSQEAGATSVTMSWTLGSDARWTIVAVPLKPAASGPTLTLADHASGQVTDKFTTSSPVTDVLYRFKLTRSDTVTVDNLRVNFTTTEGVANGDVTSCELWQDVDNDGVVDNPGDTQIQGSVTPSGGVITFTTNFTPDTGGTNYLVKCTVSNLVAGDTTTLSVGTADIDEVEGGVTESGSITNATHTQDTPANLTQIHYRWRNDNGGESAASNTTQVSATSDTTTTSNSDVLVNSMTITPGAGDYHIWFSGSVQCSTTSYQYVSLYVNGAQLAHTERQIYTEGSIAATSFPVATHAKVTGVTAGQAIEVRWRTTTGTATMHERTLMVTPIVAADSTQASATADTTTTSATDVLVDSMTITPGAGDYHVWFSSSVEGSDASSIYVSLYVNGTQLAHTERQIDIDSSVPDTAFPVATHARVTEVTAGQAIEVRWRRTAVTAKMHERTLVVSKITAANSTQASATADTTTTSATDVLVNSMTITPGAGDYHIWFSGSVSCSASDSTQNVSLYVNGIQVAHTERQIFSEGSIVGSSFPVATHAYVAGVGASQAIEVRWRTTAATATMHERTLVVEKVSTTAAATWATSQEDTKLTGYFKSGPVRLRFEVSNEGGESSGGVTYELQVAQASTCSSGSYNPVPTDTSGHWQIVGSAYITDGESTSNIDPGLTDEAATFVAGQLKDTGNTTGSITLNANEFTEIEFAIQATTNATDGANYCFCLYNATKTITYTKYAEATILAPTAVLLSSFEATAFDEAVLLEWRTGYEVSNLGFNIYREEGGQLYQLTSEPIKGSALMTGAGTRTAGYSYTWWDISAIADVRGSRYVLPPSSKLSALRYYLEDLDLNGTKTMHGPVTPVFSHNPAPQKAQSMLLSQINRQGAEGRAQDLREKLKEKNVNRYTLLGKTNNDSRITNNEASSLASRPKAGPRANISVSSMDDRNETPAGRMVSARLSDKPLKGASEVQQALAARPSVKIFIQEEGWYRVTQSELVAAGLDPAVNPRFLQLFVDGQEQPILVKGGKNDRLGSRGSIEFYGTGLDTPYTDTRVYWLVPGSKPGKRIDSHIFNPLFGNPHSAIRNSFESFPYTVEKKDRTIYVAALKNGEASNFFGSVVSSTPVDQVLKVPHLDSFAPRDALLEVSLQGVSAGAHQVMVMVNGVVVGTMAFEGQTLKVERFPLVQAGLVEGENVVTLAGQGVPLDVSLVDSIRLTYWRTYTADEDILKFTAVGGNNLSVNGFSSSSIRVMDITDLQNLKEVGGAVQGEGGGYSFRFRVPGEGKRTLLAFVDEEARTPAALELNQPSRWHHSRQEADLVIISHGDFLESLKPLKAWRESQGLSVALIDVEDLYDEFSFGIKTPEALKDFLLRAKTSWQKAPRFVLLVGDASFDPRNYYGFGHFDYVPTKLVDTAYIETASDDWFVDFDNDGIPDMAIGRIPVRTEEEAAGIVSKLIGYEQSRERMQDVLLVADLKDNDFDYMAASQGVKALLPGGLMVSEVYRDQFSDDVQVKNELVRRLNQGPLLVNYIGHGTLEFWRGDIFGSDDAEILTNGLRLPFVIGMTCLNGFFQDVYYETLAEAFLKASNGGAVAVWTSSGLTEPDKQAVMNKEMIRLLFNGEGLTIGEAVKRAKASTSDQDIRRTWILFGDPATRLKP